MVAHLSRHFSRIWIFLLGGTIFQFLMTIIALIYIKFYVKIKLINFQEGTMDTVFGKIVSVGMNKSNTPSTQGIDTSERRVNMFEIEMPVEISGRIDFDVTALEEMTDCYVLDFNILIEKWGEQSFSNVLEIYMRNAQCESFLSVNILMTNGSLRMRVRDKGTYNNDVTSCTVPMGEWFNVHIEYYGTSETAKIFLNRKFIGEYKTNYSSADADSFSTAVFYATYSASFRYALDSVYAYSTLHEYSPEPTPIYADAECIDFDGYEVGSADIPRASLDRGIRSIISVQPDPVRVGKRVLSFDITAGYMEYIDGEPIPKKSDIMICAKPGSLRRRILPYKCYYMHILVDRGEIYDELMRVPNYFEAGKTDKYRELFSKICMHYDSARGADSILLQSLILELIYHIVKGSQQAAKIEADRDGQSATDFSEKIDATIRYIKEKLSERLDLETLAAYAGYNPTYFHKIFKRATGTTLGEYVKSERIKKAADLIVTTEYTLTQIAYECGFSSQSYFSSAFKERMGATPREYERAFFDKGEEDGK